MEKETKVIKKIVKSAEEAKIGSIAAAKVDEEIGEELMPLKSQLGVIQTALNQLQSSSQQNMNSPQGQSQQQPNQMQQQQQQITTTSHSICSASTTDYSICSS